MASTRDRQVEDFMKELLGEQAKPPKPADRWEGKFMSYPVTIDAPPLIREKFVEALRLGREHQFQRDGR